MSLNTSIACLYASSHNTQTDAYKAAIVGRYFPTVPNETHVPLSTTKGRMRTFIRSKRRNLIKNAAAASIQ